MIANCFRLNIDQVKQIDLNQINRFESNKSI